MSTDNDNTNQNSNLARLKTASTLFGMSKATQINETSDDLSYRGPTRTGGNVSDSDN